ncbi:Transmembrane emp24 domain-containing protein 1 [Acropora cervicornis]|uniref:Transmembrane emp24 domain-containing protein 1 n=1 Tax=Acropora cervicornis TaxID=6130 RepID=A0AAD9QVH8_ACRCE|nr:Transmembrane emp24 domain-containing protein 1 [Acropora cervicornis]
MRSPLKCVFLAFVQWLILMPDPTGAMANGFTTVVDPGKVNCFYDELEPNRSLEIEYQVIEGGGDLDITFKIISPRGVMLVKDEKRTDEVHTVTTPHGGVYSFCFDNSFSTVAEKMVYVDLDLAAADEDSWFRTLDGSDITGKELQMDSIRNILDGIKESLEKAQQHQNYLSKKNFKNHFLVSRSSSRVFWWSLIQSIVLIGVAVCQVLIVKNFFAEGSMNQRI